MVSFHIIIPARFASSRLPYKLLMSLAGKPLLEHTYRRALLAGAASVVIATDDEKIAKVMQGCSAQVLMTKNTHETGTDRIAEAVDLLNLPDDAIVVNLQGDEPLVPSALLQQVAEDLVLHEEADIASLYTPIQSSEELFSAAITKVVCDAKGYAMYFSKAPIPWDRDGFGKEILSTHISQLTLRESFFRHLGLYAYRVRFLRIYQKLLPAPCEQLERLEQLRAMYHGFRIHLAPAREYCPPGVDTQEDFDHLQGIIASFDTGSGAKGLAVSV